MIIVAGITAVAAYQGATMQVQGSLADKDSALAVAEDTIAGLESTVAGLEDCPAGAGGAAVVPVGTLECSTCHDTDQTKGFHSVGDIKLISEAKGQTPRICTTCHGSSPHNVHQKKVDSGEMECGTCHVSAEGDFEVPQVPEGHTLVCELCHVPDDMGNYVSIHIVEANRDCSICHMCDAVKIHKRDNEALRVVG